MSEKWKKHGRDAAELVKRGAEATANGLHRVTGVVARNDGRVADGVEAGTKTVGIGLDKAGTGLSALADKASKTLHGNANRTADAVRDAIMGTDSSSKFRKAAAGVGWIAAKIATHTGGLAADTLSGIGKAAAGAGRITRTSAPVVGGTVGGALRGAAEVSSDAVDAVALSAGRIDAMRTELRSLGHAAQDRAEQHLNAINAAVTRGRKARLLDLLVIGGVTLAQVERDPSSVPENVQRAFELAYPGLANTESFSEAIERMSSQGLVGLVSGVKGKLFELELVDHLNDGGLPDGFHAELANSVTQPGWDIRVLDADGQVSELLQAKATESIQYVREALDRYPDIDVTSTAEVHGQLVALGLAQDVHDSGISDTVLQAKVEAAAHGGSAFDASDLIPSSVGLAVIALSVFMGKGNSLREKGETFGRRSARAGASGATGKLVMVATTWWLGLIAGVGAGWLATKGQGKRQQYEVLRTALEVMRRRQAAILSNRARPA